MQPENEEFSAQRIRSDALDQWAPSFRKSNCESRLISPASTERLIFFLFYSIRSRQMSFSWSKIIEHGGDRRPGNRNRARDPAPKPISSPTEVHKKPFSLLQTGRIGFFDPALVFTTRSSESKVRTLRIYLTFVSLRSFSNVYYFTIHVKRSERRVAGYDDVAAGCSDLLSQCRCSCCAVLSACRLSRRRI